MMDVISGHIANCQFCFRFYFNLRYLGQAIAPVCTLGDAPTPPGRQSLAVAIKSAFTGGLNNKHRSDISIG
ncbi:hypothetical protein E2C01_050706 [Portunus trituberculatus]|uniref:Uncharacterized protein n=1 Tax=Portunus trituberculatus TaxID=210409 RepID=A0A5B7G904_PORTR|nr:hypothetical protein [Portunus trituberculatus]